MTWEWDDYPDGPEDGGIDFADPGGGSALRAATRDNPRNLPCPSCNWPNRLTPADRARGYQCDSCADACERGHDIDYYEPERLTYDQAERESNERSDANDEA